MPFDLTSLPRLRKPFSDQLRGSWAAWDSIMDGLLFCCFPHYGTAYDIVAGRNSDSASAASGLIWPYAPDGTPGMRSSVLGTSQPLWSGAIATDVGIYSSGAGVGGAFSVWMWIYIASINSGVADFCNLVGRPGYVSESNNQGWLFQKGPKSGGSDGTPTMYFDCFNNNGFTNYRTADPSLTLAAGQVNNYVAIIQFDPAGGGGNKFLYRDAVLRNSPVGTGYAAPNSTAPLVVGGFEGSSPATNIYILGFGVWNKTLSADEIRLLNSFPQALLQPALRSQHHPWRHQVYGAYAVPGNLALSATVPQPQGFVVAGNVSLSVPHLTGTVGVHGAFNCAGAVTARFQPPTTSSFKVAGNIAASFLRRGGQPVTCISGPETPAAGKPANAVH